jgi:hypothetical protein
MQLRAFEMSSGHWKVCQIKKSIALYLVAGDVYHQSMSIKP